MESRSEATEIEIPALEVVIRALEIVIPSGAREVGGVERPAVRLQRNDVRLAANANSPHRRIQGHIRRHQVSLRLLLKGRAE